MSCPYASRCAALACVQGTLTLVGIVLSLLPYLDETVARPPTCLVGTSLCTAHWGLWMSPPASFWAGVAAACMFQGVSRGDKRALATAFDLQLLVAPCCLVLFVLLGWKALTAATDGHADGLHFGKDVTFKAVATYAGLSLVMQAQAITCTIGACLVRSARDAKESSSGGGSGGSRGGRRSGLPRGWRMLSTADGRAFYEHRRTGRVQWEAPTASMATSSEAEEGLSTVPEGSPSTFS